MDITIGVGEGRCIEEVVRLGTELELHPLRDREVLEDPEVDRSETGALELVAFHISSTSVERVPAGREHGRRSEGAGEVGDTVRDGASAANKSASHMLELHKVSAVINIANTAGIDIKRCATVDSHDRVGLPSADHLIHKPRSVVAELLVVTEGKVVHQGRDEGVTLVLIRVAIVQSTSDGRRRPWRT